MSNKGKFKDITGQKFNSLTAIKRVGVSKNKTSIWLFKCDCGVEKNFVLSIILNGKIKNCGCLRKGKLKDITGQKFNRLTAIKQIGTNEKGKTTWLFSCECGVQKILVPSLVVKGFTKSCGCLKKDGKSNAMFSHGGSGTRLYKTFLGMHRRCEDVKNIGYKDYGERGIKVSDEWQSFVVFRDWALNNGYSDDLTMDRIDNNKGYESSNIRWADKTVQTRNRRNTLWYNIDGVKKTLAEWCEILNVKYRTASERKRRNGSYFTEEELQRLPKYS